MKASNYQSHIESCIQEIARRFVRNGGEGAFDLYNEREVEGSLFSELRRSPVMKAKTTEGIRRNLVHLQQPSVEGRLIDMVIWHPSDIDLYREDWGCSLTETAPLRRLLAAIQLKHGHGEITPPDGIMKDLIDLESIDDRRKTKQTLLYFLEFADCCMGGGLGKNRYGRVQSTLRLWCDKDPERRKAMFLTKEKIGYAYPQGRWTIDPLPPGVTGSPFS